MLSTLLRKTQSLYRTSAAAAIRGPKKKKGGAKESTPVSEDIVNIFKGGKDPLVYPSDMYPPWVMALLEAQYLPDDVMMQMYRGERLPEAKEQWRVAKSIRRQRIKDRNFLIKERVQYVSDDDCFVETLGEFQDEEEEEVEYTNEGIAIEKEVEEDSDDD